MSAPVAAAVPSDIDPVPPSIPASPPRLEITARALLLGCVIGAVLAAGNVYASLKVGIVDCGSMTAALLAFALFTTFKSLGRTPYGVLENNITQTTASSAAAMSFVAGIVGPIPALALLGTTYPAWAFAIWGVAVAVVGIFVGTLLRRRLVVEESLPFPTGAATGELMATMYGGAREASLRRALLLVVTGVLAGVVTWFRDGRPSVIPEATMFPGVVAGMTAASLTLGVSWSPLLVSTGAMMGLRGAASMFLGGAVARIALQPWMLRNHVVPNAEYGTLNAWFVWPALGLLIAASFMPLLLGAGAIGRSFRDLAFLRRASSVDGAPAAPDPALARRLWLPLLGVSLPVIFLVGWRALGIQPVALLIGLTMALLLTNISARATGETDISPGGTVGTITQLALASRGTAGSILGGSLSLATTSQVSQTLWSYKAGRRVGASPRAQLWAQIVGAALGAAVVMPTYAVIVASYGLANEKMPATVAQSWKATAEALRGGMGAFPPYGVTAGLIGLGVGIVLTLLGRTRFGARVPAPAAMGVAILLPFSLSMAVLVGGVAVALLRRFRPSVDDHTVMAAASGGMAGEAMVGVAIAVLKVTGIL